MGYKGYTPIVTILLALITLLGGFTIFVWKTSIFDVYLPQQIREILGKNISSNEKETPDASWTQQERSTLDMENLTKGWKTYYNEEAGFSFKYPGDWIENPNQNGSFSVGSEDGQISLSLYKNFQGGREHWSRTEEETYLTEDGSSVFATVFYGEDNPNDIVVDGVFYPVHPEISFIHGFNLQENPNGFLILELILSTFKFL